MNNVEPNKVTINGVQMSYRRYGEGQPLLLLHGFMGAGSDWSLIFEEPPAGYSFIIPDLRGHGHSDAPLDDFSFKQCAQDVIALLDWLDIKTVSAIGLSGGAQTLLHIATMQPKRIDKLVLVSTGHYFPQQARQAMASLTFDAIPPDELAQMRKRHAKGDAQIKQLYEIGHAFKDSYEDVNFTPTYLSTIEATTLIVHGDSDPLYPVAMSLEMVQAIPKSKLWVIPDGGHLPIFSAAVESFRGVLLEFLK
ncbi:MAG: alpha/beta hydrolase [Deinococcota bacterium]